MSFGDRLKKIRQDNDLTQEELAKKINTSRSNIANYENDKNMPSIDILTSLANTFNCSIDYLLGKSDTKNNTNKTESNAFPTSDVPLKFPVLGKISAGLPILAQENIEGYEFAPSSFIKEDFDYFYLKVTGDSMNLKFPEGNLVLVQKQPTLENGEIGVILVGDNEATVKKYRCENDLIILEPMSTNPEHTTQIYNPKSVNIKIIGKVILHLGKV